MKRILAILVMLGALSIGAMAQDVDTTVTRPFFKDTLTATIDTIGVSFALTAGSFDYYSISAYTTSGTDTATVSVQSPDGLFFTQIGMVDLSDGSDVTQIVITTAPKQFALMDTQPAKIRLITPDHTANLVFVITRKGRF